MLEYLSRFFGLLRRQKTGVPPIVQRAKHTFYGTVGLLFGVDGLLVYILLLGYLEGLSVEAMPCLSSTERA
ncbi:MAG: hypothetical protein JOZ19_02995 [Rubrobacter sp.]|nr:hypothetical protein [Rubrobacter sp.]